MPESTPRIRVLFVIAHLVQSGSERFVYEACRALDRGRYDVHVLTGFRMSANDYYYWKLLELGIPVHRRLPLFLDAIRRHLRGLYWLAPARALLVFAHRIVSRLSLGKFLSTFDVINAVQIENYYLLQPLLPDNDRVLTYLMSNAFQYRFDPYEACDPRRSYRFVITDRTQPDDYANSPCRHATSVFLPLTMDLQGRPDLSQFLPPPGAPLRIGVFMRLSPERPISGLFQALKRLREQHDTALYVYGRGNPDQFTPELEELELRKHVSFRGHTEDIAKSIQNDGLVLVWMPSNETTIGYASVEIAGLAIPMAFWNLGNSSPAGLAKATDGSMHSFAAPLELADYTSSLLQDRQALMENGQALRKYVIRAYDIRSHIHILEEGFAEIVRQSGPARRS